MVPLSANHQNPRQSLPYRFVFALLVLCSLPSVTAIAAEQKKPVLPKAAESLAPPPPAGIPLADIAARATQVSNLLGSLTASAASSAQIDTIAKTLPDLSESLDAEFAATTRSLEAEPSLEMLQALQQQWQRRQMETTGWLSALTQQATRLQNGLNQLNDLQKTWNSTRASALASKAPGPILQQIDATLTAITTAQATLQSERTAVLNLQSRVAQEVTKCGAALAQIGQIQQRAVAGIFARDAPPIWTVELWKTLADFPDYAHKVATVYWTDFLTYLRDPRYGVPLHAGLFIVLALVFCAARRRIPRWTKDGAVEFRPITVFERPYAAAAVISLLAATSPYFQMATSVRQALAVLALVPTIRVSLPTVDASLAPGIYALGVLFAVDMVRQAFAGAQLIGQVILIVETLAGILVVIWLRRHHQQIVGTKNLSSSQIALRLSGFLVVLVLFFALAAGSAGYMRLARLLSPGILVGAVLALIAYAYLRVGGGIAALAFRVWPLRMLRMVQHHPELIERRVYLLFAWAAVGGWLVRYLNYLGLLDPTWSLANAILAAKLERGVISISLGTVLEFFLTLWVAYLLSKFIRFVLQEDVYPRVQLAPGLSYAASSVLNYVILALGFLAGLGVLGVDFTKVSIMAGAFGVGIGFGLQSVVNNFVSGLILLFERPIHIGDTVEVGNLQGTVRRIGIRASVIHTGAGADIIVPNSQLITDKVTNWTFSDRLRRVDLPVGVNYGADPKKVIELLEQVARAHPDVLPDPAPRALFISYGDSSINFELSVWPKQFYLSAQVKSDLATAVYDAVHAAGMSFPRPQREVRLLRDHDARAPMAAPNVVMKE
ncbi:MAG: mechanosensitive ion channel domain-containing protein [Candidatus Binatia bacterium]